MNLVRNKRACFRCLCQGHASSTCRKNFTCQEGNCGQPHHRLLHASYVAGETFHSELKGNAILQVQTLKVNKTNNKTEKGSNANYLCDNGSTTTFITFHLAELMKLVDKQNDVYLKRMGDKKGQHSKSMEYVLYLEELNGERLKIEAYGVDRIISDRYYSVNAISFNFKTFSI